MPGREELMRHRDKTTVTEALQDWQRLRQKVESEGGDNYDKPVLVKFFDTGTFEVMERDIVEDEFYVLRKWKILRELDPAGKDLEQAIKESRRDAPREPARPRQRQGNKGGRRRGKRTSRRGGKRGGRGRGNPSS